MALSDYLYGGSQNLLTQFEQATAGGAPTNSGNSGYNYGPSTPSYYYDSMGNKYGSAAEANAANTKITQAKQAQEGIFASGRSAANSLVGGYDTQVSDFTRNYGASANSLNENRATNQLNLRRSMANIAASVRNGLNSGAVSLGNMNALSSGAADALRRAYAQQGSKQVTAARGDSALKERQYAEQQRQLELQKQDALRTQVQFRDAEVDRVYQETLAKLRALEAETAITGVVDIAGADRIKAQAIEALHNIDLMRDSRLGSAQFLSPQEIQQRASEMEAAGMGGFDPFKQAQDTSQEPKNSTPLSQFPLYVKSKEDTPLPVGA